MALNKKTVALVAVALTFFLAATFHQTNILPDGVSALYRGASKPRYIFVDLGANRADSLEAFLQHPGAKFEFDFPRPSWATHEQAEIYLFEANPVFNPALVEAKERYTAQGKKIHIFPSTVADVTDGTRTFYLDTINEAHDFWGSSTYANHADVVNSKSTGTVLSAVNIARWLLMNTLPRDFVVVKVDIEGAEFDLIPHFVEMKAWTVIDHLLVEWHSSLPSEDARQAAVEAVGRLSAEGVNTPPYNSGA
ncbi:FkbM family methyltransferase [Colletotrichum graminicola]|uniref:FkbM family methyltransferase n=1 Tax=Colletotrichum graminicola (strain M1.001 / M2 / FGSC 10212) TaxID=645133 RepID=E3QSY4_COLGM|nr:FkbM family methyltransferase [Colletotrichum graminicola M1.001]EFQ33972.1 FkbM family methyltransferase [Colletotrichum graminicola M1.001]WDK21171.1 FkbM family methyltransferase [Colletotrichum graminicola]